MAWWYPKPTKTPNTPTDAPNMLNTPKISGEYNREINGNKINDIICVNTGAVDSLNTLPANLFGFKLIKFYYSFYKLK